MRIFMKKKKEKEEITYADRYREIGYKIAYCRKHMNLTQEELAEKNHNFELVPCGSTVWNLDFRQNGIGSNSCGPRLLEKYRLAEEAFTFSLNLKPEHIKKG